MDAATLGNRIKTRRESMRLSQVQLAHSLHLSPQAISKWERGLSMPDVSLLPLLSQFLHVSLDDLLEVSQPRQATLQVTVITTSMRGFAHTAAQLPPHQVAHTLNGWFLTLTECVVGHQGIPVKYVGDGFLGYFTGDNQTHQALATCHDLFTIPMGDLVVGLVQGPVYIGAIGHPDYAQLDLIGDVVNQAFLLNQWVSAAGFKVGIHDPNAPIPIIAEGVALASERVSIRGW